MLNRCVSVDRFHGYYSQKFFAGVCIKKSVEIDLLESAWSNLLDIPESGVDLGTDSML